MASPDTSTLLARLRTVLDLTNTEIQIAETRVAQAPDRRSARRIDAKRRKRSGSGRSDRDCDP